MKKVAALLFALLLVLGLVACSNTAQPESKLESTLESTPKPTPNQTADPVVEPIILGSIQDISSETSVYGRMISEGIKWRVQIINDNGGINGRPIKLIEYDSKASVDESLNAYNRLVQEGAILVFGPHPANIGIALAPVAQEAKVPVFTLGMDDRVTRQGEDGKGAPWDYMFLVQPSCDLQARIMAKYTVQELGYTRISALYRQDNSYSVSLFEGFKNYCEANGAEIVVEETFKKEDNDYKTMLVKMLDAKPDCIYVPNYLAELIPIVQQARGLGYDGPIIESLDATPPFAEMCGPESHDVYFISNVNYDDPAVIEVLDAYVDAGNKMPEEILKFCVSYDMMGVVGEILVRTGDDKEAIRSELESLKGYKGLTGTISIDPKTHQPYGLGMNIYKVMEDGSSKFLQFYVAE